MTCLCHVVKANADENARIRLCDKEVIAQMHHLTAAGHETTSNTITWMLYELAKHPEYQTLIRQEIRETRMALVSRGDSNFSLDDIDNMRYMMAAIKVGLHKSSLSHFPQAVIADKLYTRKRSASIPYRSISGVTPPRTT